METGTPGVKSTTDGWLNRYCQHNHEHQETPFRAVAFGPQLPRIMGGTAPSLAIDDLKAFGLQAGRPETRDKLTRAFESLYQGSATGMLASTSEESFEAVRMLEEVNPAQYRPAAGVEYPRGNFGQSLMQIAQLIKANMGLEVAFADIGGWDTHVNQGAADGQWPSPTSAAGTPTSIRARPTASWPIVCGSSVRGWRRFPQTWENAWPTWWC